MKSSSSVGPRGFDLSEFGLSEIARPWLVVSAGCSPAAIWCNSPPAAGCESPVGAEPFFCLRFPDVLVVILLPLIDLLVVNVSLARSRLIIPSFCRVNQDFHFGFPATIDYTSARLRESVFPILSIPIDSSGRGRGPALPHQSLVRHIHARNQRAHSADQDRAADHGGVERIAGKPCHGSTGDIARPIDRKSTRLNSSHANI